MNAGVIRPLIDFIVHHDNAKLLDGRGTLLLFVNSRHENISVSFDALSLLSVACAPTSMLAMLEGYPSTRRLLALLHASLSCAPLPSYSLCNASSTSIFPPGITTTDEPTAPAAGLSRYLRS
jgi:hypothetical protein